MVTVGILGVGELTEKILVGLRRSEFSGKILLSPRNQERARRLSRVWTCTAMADNQSVVEGSDLLFLGVRPNAVAELAQEITLKPDQTLVSLVAGMSLDHLRQAFPSAFHVRAMLSYAAQINQSTVVVTPGGEPHESVLSALGALIVLDREEEFELATVAACMNGWFYFFLNDLQKWFVDNGLSQGQAAQLVLGNMEDCLASARSQPLATFEELGSAIATPGTFTAAGLDSLREKGAMTAWTDTCEKVLTLLSKAT